MSDFSQEAALIVEAVRNAANDITEAAQQTATLAADPTPTPFQRAVIGALVLQTNAVQQHAAVVAESTHQRLGGMGWFTDQELGAARRAIFPYLDETPVPPSSPGLGPK